MSVALHRRLRSDARGAAIIELALIAPVLGTMVIGIVDMSNAFSRKLALEQGAQRAIERIEQTTAPGTVENTLQNEVVCQVNGMTAGTCNTTPITTSSVTVTFRLDCTDSSGTTTSQTFTDSTTFDGNNCSSGKSMARYVQVQVTDKYTPMFPIHFYAIDPDGTYHLSATAGMRTS
jgi:Flp pilus assembly protein TadG